MHLQGAIPGYWMTVFTVDRIGRRPIQIGGFAILTIIFCVLGVSCLSIKWLFYLLRISEMFDLALAS